MSRSVCKLLQYPLWVSPFSYLWLGHTLVESPPTWRESPTRRRIFDLRIPLPPIPPPILSPPAWCVRWHPASICAQEASTARPWSLILSRHNVEYSRMIAGCDLCATFDTRRGPPGSMTICVEVTIPYQLGSAEEVDFSPSLHCHYSNFFATTGSSVPAVCIDTFPLRGFHL
jgi:hypothetical protein